MIGKNLGAEQTKALAPDSTMPYNWRDEMKAYEVSKIFETSVWKLKDKFGMEASGAFVINVTKAFDKEYPGMEGAVALCLPDTDYENLEMTASLSIFPHKYLSLGAISYMTNKEIRFSIMTTACHEMAHYLHFSREMKAIRNQYGHDKAVARTAWRLFLQEVNYHGEDWQRIMTEEMGSTDGEYWTPSYEMPKIFRR